MLDVHIKSFQDAINKLSDLTEILKNCVTGVKLLEKVFKEDGASLNVLKSTERDYLKLISFFQGAISIFQDINSILVQDDLFFVADDIKEIIMGYNIVDDVLKKDDLYCKLSKDGQYIKSIIKKIKRVSVLSDDDLKKFFSLLGIEMLAGMEEYAPKIDDEKFLDKNVEKQLRKSLLAVNADRKAKSVKKNISILINKLNHRYGIKIDSFEIVYDNKLSVFDNYNKCINDMMLRICNALDIEQCLVILHLEFSGDEIISLPYKDVFNKIIIKIDESIKDKKEKERKQREIAERTHYLELVKSNCPNIYRINNDLLLCRDLDFFKQFYKKLVETEELFNIYNNKLKLLGFDDDIIIKDFINNHQELNEIALNCYFKKQMNFYIKYMLQKIFENYELNLFDLSIGDELYNSVLNDNISSFLTDVDLLLKEALISNLSMFIYQILGVPTIAISNNAMANIKEFIDVYYLEIMHGQYSIDYFIFQNVDEDGQYVLYNRLLDSIDINDYNIFVSLLKEILLYKNENDIKMEIIKCLQNYIISVQKKKSENNYAKMLSCLSNFSLFNIDEFIGTVEDDAPKDHYGLNSSNINILFTDLSTIDLEKLDASFKTKKELMDYLFFIKDGINYLVCCYNNITDVGFKNYMHAKYTDCNSVYKLKHNLLRATYSIFGSAIVIDDLFLRSSVSKGSYHDRIIKSSNKFKNGSFVNRLLNDYSYYLSVLIKIINIYEYLHNNSVLTKEEIKIDDMCMVMLINKFVNDVLDSEDLSSDDKKVFFERVKSDLEFFMGQEVEKSMVLAKMRLKNE